MNPRKSFLVLAFAGLSSFSSHATTLGLTDYSGSSQRAFWDSYGATTFSGAAPTSSAGFTGAGLSQSSTAGFPYGPFDNGSGPDYFYDFTNATSWDIDFTSTATVQTLVLQIKGNTPAAGTLGTYFTPVLTINGNPVSVDGPGVVAGPTGEVVFGSFDMNVATYTWTGINAVSGSAFNISMDRLSGNHEAVDGFQIAAVPEPSTYALLGLGLLGLMVFQRYRKRA